MQASTRNHRTTIGRTALAVIMVLGASTAMAGRHHRHDGHDRADHDRSGHDAYHAAYDHHRARDWAKAAESWLEARQAGYREATSAYNLACAYARLGDADRAMEWLERAISEGFEVDGYIETDSDLVSLRSDARFQALRATHRADLAARAARGEDVDDAYSEALASFQELSKEGGTRDDWYDVGMDLHRLGEYDRALDAWRRAAELEPSSGTTLYNMACALARMGKTDAAVEMLDKAIQAGYGDPQHMDRDDDLDSMRGDRRYQESRATAELLELPSQDDWHGLNWFYRPGWDTAKARYEGYLKNHPTSGRAWFNLGYANLQTGAPTEAVKAFERARELGYRPSTSAYNVACSHARAGNTDAAFEWLDRAFEEGFDSFGHLRHDKDLDSLRSDPRFPKFDDRQDEDRSWKNFGKRLRRHLHRNL